MTRKDYIAIARAISDSVRVQEGQGKQVDGIMFTAEMIARELKTDNPRFDRDRFMRACGLDELADN